VRFVVGHAAASRVRRAALPPHPAYSRRGIRRCARRPAPTASALIYSRTITVLTASRG